MSIHQMLFSGYESYRDGLNYSYWTTDGTNPTSQQGFDAFFTGTPAGTGVHSTVINWDHTNSRGTKPSYLPNDAFAWQVEGYIYIPTAATYQFGTGSDDGNQLTIDGTIVTSFYGGRGVPGTVTNPNDISSSIVLGVGYYTFRYRMQEGGGGDGGYVAMRVNGGSWDVLPASYYFRLP